MRKERGLSTIRAEHLRIKFGKNLLPENPPPSNVSLFLSQFKNPLIYVLLVAGVLTIAIQHFSDALIILISVSINTVLGFIQERKASTALYALKHYVSSESIVFREGKRTQVDTEDLVPGDVVILSQGTKIPADGVLISANRLFVNESILTGESISVEKVGKNETFMGTTVATGQGIMRVTTIGAQTRMGAIALKIQEKEEDTPLQKQLKIFSRQLILVITVLIFIVFILGILRGYSLTEIFVTSVALAVSSIPEGLIVSLTVVLAIGMQKILKRKGLVRKLSAAETLGGVTTICVDKTGTLTEGRMEVVTIVGDTKKIAEQVLTANDLDDPIVVAAYAWGKKIIPEFTNENTRLDSIPFSSEARCFVSLNSWNSQANRMFVNGAPEVILNWTTLTKKQRHEVLLKIDELTKQGMRLMGVAYKSVSLSKKRIENTDHKSDLIWGGVLAFSDPVRSGVKTALEKASAAGIRTVVITGDYAKTSQFVLSQLGIELSEDQIITGEEVRKLSVAELSEKVQSIRLFARTTPDQKLMIVKAFKRNGEVVSMMGDGVNDAPALHESDIGVAVGEATDVAKESADLVLLNSNFSTIIASIEEGRSIFENIRKIILYLMTDAFAEIIVVLGSILLGFPLAISAVQILWVNLVSDGFPNLALTIDPTRASVMSERPRSPREQLVNSWMFLLIGVVSTVAGLLALGSFVFVHRQSGDIELARSVAFITLGLNSLIYVFSLRSLMLPFWKSNLFENKWLVLAVLSGFVLQWIPFSLPITRKFFGLVPLSVSYWIAAIGLSLAMFAVVEVFKLIYHNRIVKGRV